MVDTLSENDGTKRETSAETLGHRIQTARKSKGWTLEETSRRASIGRSTLSKIENDQTKPSFEIVQRLTEVLEISTPQLFAQSSADNILGRRDFTAKDAGEKKKTSTYEHELLCVELMSKRMLPYVSTITARDEGKFDDWIRHEGEEFLYVLSGEILFLCEHYRPKAMRTGDSIYYDSGMGHGCISTSDDDAKVLWVSIEK